MIVIGVDPGASGAAVEISNGQIQRIARFKKGYKGLHDLISSTWMFTNTVWFMEKVFGMPWDTGGNAFTFGRGYGIVEGALAQRGLDFRDAPPKAWIKELQIPKMPTYTGRKQENQRVAKRLFPESAHLITQDVADAVLIAEYGRRMLLKEGMDFGKKVHEPIIFDCQCEI